MAREPIESHHYKLSFQGALPLLFPLPADSDTEILAAAHTCLLYLKLGTEQKLCAGDCAKYSFAGWSPLQADHNTQPCQRHVYQSLKEQLKL